MTLHTTAASATGQAAAQTVQPPVCLCPGSPADSFDRVVCASPCDTMHTWCGECGLSVEPCAHEVSA